MSILSPRDSRYPELSMLLNTSLMFQIAVGIGFLIIIPVSNIEWLSFLKEFNVDGQPMITQFFGLLMIFAGLASYEASKEVNDYRRFIYWDVFMHFGIMFVQAYALFVVGIESVLIQLALWISMIVDPLWGAYAIYLLKRDKLL